MMNDRSTLQQKNNGLTSYLSPLAVWALAFGCSVGWGSFVMPGTTFLPNAGPLGSVLGLLIGAAFLIPIAYCYSRMMQRYPDAGGAFSFTKNTLGGDHGFLCAWMLLLTYIAIIWANATALSLFVRYAFGDILCFGFSYEVAGYTVYAGEILASAGLISFTCLACIASKNIAKWLQTIGAILLFGGIIACFVAVVIHRGGFEGITPLFSEGGDPVDQVVGIVILAPWAFIGFESISHSTGEFRFSAKKSMPIFIVSLITAALAYIMLTMCASMAHPDGYTGWGDYIKSLVNNEGIASLPTFYSAREAMGHTGLMLIGIAAFSGILTGMIGHTVALSRLIKSAADDEMIPKVFQKTNRRGVPWVAVCLISVVSCLILFMGRSAIGWIVDVTTIGATIVYGYTSISAYIQGRKEKHKPSMFFGLFGTITSLIVVIIYLLPSIRAQTQLPTESYMILIIWGILGIVAFRLLIAKDKSRRYGKSFGVWIILFFLILIITVIWVNKAAVDEAAKISHNIEIAHDMTAERTGLNIYDENVMTMNRYTTESVNAFGLDVRNNVYILAALILFSLIIIFSIFSVVKKREQDIEAERVHAEETSRAKSVFLSNMSHDIRTPMNAVTGYTTLALQEENLPDNIRDYLEKIEFSGKHLLTLINDILDMSRIESGKVELDYINTDLISTLDEVKEIFSIQMKTKDLEFVVDHSSVKNRYVICDKNRLDRVLLNLISNAYKFTPEGGKVSVILKQTGLNNGKADYELVVRDTGIGMSPEFVEHIFDAFERERSSTVSQLQGTGLGMSIAKSFVELMGGTISVDTEPNKGTAFIVSVRFPTITEEMYKPAAQEKTADTVDHTGVRILIVEDNPINSEIAREILTRADFEVETAENGKVAVEMLSDAEPGYYRVVLMDIMMPVMNGYEATKAIRELDAQRAKVPIIAVSANTFESDIREAKEAGMDGHVSKPFEPDKLISTINDFL